MTLATSQLQPLSGKPVGEQQPREEWEDRQRVQDDMFDDADFVAALGLRYERNGHHVHAARARASHVRDMDPIPRRLEDGYSKLVCRKDPVCPYTPLKATKRGHVTSRPLPAKFTMCLVTDPIISQYPNE